MRGTVAFIYEEGSTLFSQKTPSLLDKVKSALLHDRRKKESRKYPFEREIYSKPSQQAERIIRQMEDYFGP